MQAAAAASGGGGGGGGGVCVERRCDARAADEGARDVCEADSARIEEAVRRTVDAIDGARGRRRRRGRGGIGCGVGGGVASGIRRGRCGSVHVAWRLEGIDADCAAQHQTQRVLKDAVGVAVAISGGGGGVGGGGGGGEVAERGKAAADAHDINGAVVGARIAVDADAASEAAERLAASRHHRLRRCGDLGGGASGGGGGGGGGWSGSGGGRADTHAPLRVGVTFAVEPAREACLDGGRQGAQPQGPQEAQLRRPPRRQQRRRERRRHCRRRGHRVLQPPGAVGWAAHAEGKLRVCIGLGEATRRIVDRMPAEARPQPCQLRRRHRLGRRGVARGVVRLDKRVGVRVEGLEHRPCRRGAVVAGGARGGLHVADGASQLAAAERRGLEADQRRRVVGRERRGGDGGAERAGAVAALRRCADARDDDRLAVLVEQHRGVGRVRGVARQAAHAEVEPRRLGRVDFHQPPPSDHTRGGRVGGVGGVERHRSETRLGLVDRQTERAESLDVAHQVSRDLRLDAQLLVPRPPAAQRRRLAGARVQQPRRRRVGVSRRRQLRPHRAVLVDHERRRRERRRRHRQRRLGERPLQRKRHPHRRRLLEVHVDDHLDVVAHHRARDGHLDLKRERHPLDALVVDPHRRRRRRRRRLGRRHLRRRRRRLARHQRRPRRRRVGRGAARQGVASEALCGEVALEARGALDDAEEVLGHGRRRLGLHRVLRILPVVVVVVVAGRHRRPHRRRHPVGRRPPRGQVRGGVGKEGRLLPAGFVADLEVDVLVVRVREGVLPLRADRRRPLGVVPHHVLDADRLGVLDEPRCDEVAEVVARAAARGPGGPVGHEALFARWVAIPAASHDRVALVVARFDHADLVVPFGDDFVATRHRRDEEVDGAAVRVH